MHEEVRQGLPSSPRGFRIAVVVSETDGVDYSRLSMSLGEAIFTQRAIRRFRPDPILDDIGGSAGCFAQLQFLF